MVAPRTIVGIIGNIIALSNFASPIPTITKICKAKSVMNFKPDPYLATVLNCCVWSFYAAPIITEDNFLVMTINVLGVVIELIYVMIFLVYSPSDKRKKIAFVLVIEIVFEIILVLITLKVFHTHGARVFLVGIVGVVFNVIMYASPLTVMRTVIRTKSVKYMPLFLSLTSFANGIVWMTYALLKFDPFILFPNSLGTLSGAVQLLLYAIYYRTTDWDAEEEEEAGDVKPPKEVQLADAV